MRNDHDSLAFLMLLLYELSPDLGLLGVQLAVAVHTQVHEGELIV